jgi:hypothetical protein
MWCTCISRSHTLRWSRSCAIYQCTCMAVIYSLLEKTLPFSLNWEGRSRLASSRFGNYASNIPNSWLRLLSGIHL